MRARAESRSFLSRLRSILKSRVALLVLSAGMALAGLEVALRLLAPQNLIRLPPSIWARDDGLGWRHAADLDLAIDFGSGSVLLRTDERGFRIGQRSRPATTRILALGDSFLAGLQVEQGETFAAHLGRTLGDRVAIDNSGVGGWDPNHYLILARRELERQRYAALVVFLYAGNDIIDQRVEHFPAAAVEPARFHFPRAANRAELTNALGRPANDYLERRSHLFKFFKDRSVFLRIRLGLAPHYFPRVLLTENADWEGWETTASICRDIADLAESRDVGALFVLLPTIHQTDPEIVEPYLQAFEIDRHEVDLDQPSKRLRDAFSEVNLGLADLTEPLRTWRARTGEPLHGAVDTHLTAAGHLAVATLLEAELSRLLGSARPAASQKAVPKLR